MNRMTIKVKESVERPFAFKRLGGLVISRKSLIKAIKEGDMVKLGKITVGAGELRQLLNAMNCDDCLVKSNGHLEIETIGRRLVRTGERTSSGSYVCRTGFTRPKKNWACFKINPNAWVTNNLKNLVVLRPTVVEERKEKNEQDIPGQP